MSNKVFSIPKFLTTIGIASSRSEAERLIKSGAVEINGEKITDFRMFITKFRDGSQIIGYF